MLTGAWILALLMAGAPLIALSGSGAETDEPEDDAVPETPEETPQTAAADEPASAEARDEPDGPPLPPTDYEFIVKIGGDHSVGGFRPGTDTLTLTLGDWEFDLHDLGTDQEGAGLRIDRFGETSVLRFPGLCELPRDDIYLHVSEPDEEPQRIALRDALYPEDIEPPPLAPTDPDAPDSPPEDPSSNTPLAPADAEAQDVLPDPLHTADFLSPTDPDAPEDAGRTP